MHALNPSIPRAALRATTVAAALAVLAGCSTVENFLAGDKVDYRSQSAKTTPLEVPPDLTQLQRDGRFATSSGSVSASAYQAGTPAAAAASAAAASVAPAAVGEMKVMREGNQRWLVVPMSAEQLWPQLREFWTERGFNLVIDNAQAGVMETDWAENRAKIPQDIIRRTVGRVLDSLYDTGERDRFRTRIERNGQTSEVYISHRGMIEELTGDVRNQTTFWTARPSDPGLEAEFLTRLMVKLGVKEAVAKETVAKPIATAPARARAIDGQPALQVDEGFDRAWRRVGLALDRGGFTVEDRDRAGGLYFVRYVDPKKAATNAEQGFFSKLFSFGKTEGAAPVRYRIAVKGEGERTSVTVQNTQGAPENSDVGQRIVALLVDDLK